MIGQDDWQKGRDRRKGEGFRIYCETKKNVDELAKRIEAKGGRLDQGPTDQPWGVRDIAVTDPDGFKITIAHSL
jgi:catechol 2,3-dioxygenase-like lactoylglutathione lyase family enzyme